MNIILLGLIVLILLFGSAMLGMFVRTRLPEHHLNSESKDVLRLAIGIIATLCAMVLGLLISTTKVAFDRLNLDLKHSSGQVLQLDRALAQYGSETGEIRKLVKQTYSDSVELVLSGDESALAKLESPEKQAQLDRLPLLIHALSPRDDMQRAQQGRALADLSELSNTRFNNIVQVGGTIPRPLFVVLVFWLAMLSLGFGLFSPRNLTAAVGLFACSLCLSVALAVLIDLDRPITGVIKVNAVPMRNAISHLGE